jgi:hypothetical protein
MDLDEAFKLLLPHEQNRGLIVPDFKSLAKMDINYGFWVQHMSRGKKQRVALSNLVSVSIADCVFQNAADLHPSAKTRENSIRVRSFLIIMPSIARNSALVLMRAIKFSSIDIVLTQINRKLMSDDSSCFVECYIRCKNARFLYTILRKISKSMSVIGLSDTQVCVFPLQVDYTKLLTKMARTLVCKPRRSDTLYLKIRDFCIIGEEQ